MVNFTFLTICHYLFTAISFGENMLTAILLANGEQVIKYRRSSKLNYYKTLFFLTLDWY